MFASTNVHHVQSIQIERSRLKGGSSLVEIRFETDEGAFTLTAFCDTRLAVVDDTRTDEQLDEAGRALDERNPETEIA